MRKSRMQTSHLNNHSANKLHHTDKAVHDWYRFVLSFPPHLVRDYLNKFDITAKHQVLDPFCGTGTTLVECKKLGIPSVGFEANPMAQFASMVKTDWSIDHKQLLHNASMIYNTAAKRLKNDGLIDEPLFSANPRNGLKLKSLDDEQMKLILTNSISALPIHKALTLIEVIEDVGEQPLLSHMKLAFAKALVESASNLHFGPEVGVRKAKPDAPMLAPWLKCVEKIAMDLNQCKEHGEALSKAWLCDSRRADEFIEPEAIDFVFTSPPYPNEKDYTRTTRLESVLLGFIRDRNELRRLKHGLIRSNTRNVYKADDDDLLIAKHDEIQSIAAQIEKRRVELGKTSGFERLYAKTTKLYFGGMARHLKTMTKVLKKGAVLGYVVGDQASYLRVKIETGRLLAEIAQSLGYDLLGIDLFRTRYATATKENLREEVVLLQWNP